jgi:hypothetical protein
VGLGTFRPTQFNRARNRKKGHIDDYHKKQSYKSWDVAQW